VGGASVAFDEQVHRFGGPVGHDPAGGEVGEQFGPPGAQGAAQPGDLGHGAGQRGGDDALGAGPAVLGVVGGVGGHEILGHGPGGGDLAVGVTLGQTSAQLIPGPLGEPVVAATGEPPGAVERVVAVPAPSKGVLLDPAADLIEGVEAQLADVERVEHPHRGRELVAQRGGIPPVGVQRRDADPRLPALGSISQPAAQHRPGPARHQVQQAGRASGGQVDDAGRERGRPDRALGGLVAGLWRTRHPALWAILATLILATAVSALFVAEARQSARLIPLLVAGGGPPMAADAVLHKPRIPAEKPPGALRTTGWASSNWSGYAETGSGFSSVTGSWIVQGVSPTSGSTYSSQWVGIDGFNNSSLIQTGTESDYINGSAVYRAWWEILPAAESVIPGMTVKPGDQVTASVVNNGGNSWTISITVGGQRFSTTQTYSGPRTSAEWIEEAPTVGGRVAPLANYGLATFDPGTVNGLNPGLTASESGVMVQHRTQVSTPSTPDSDTDGFKMEYGSTAPAPPTS